jgi:HK97 family phage portal protein
MKLPRLRWPSFKTRATVPVTDGLTPTGVQAFGLNQGSSWGMRIGDFFSGAWQAVARVDPIESVLAFSAVYSCVTLISDDISKLRIKLMKFDVASGIWTETMSSAFSPVLKKPNAYQTRIQFLQAWVLSKLIHGNTYVLKERDQRGVVTALYILNPLMVKPMVATDGSVFYQLTQDKLSNMLTAMVVPASEIIHDRGPCFFHPLVGVGPIFACGMSATQGNKIQRNSSLFFQNMSRPSGQLTSDDEISDETAERLKREFESNFAGSNIGRLLVAGSGLKYEAMAIPAQQAQLIEQLGWTVEDVARCFHVPLHKISSDTQVKYTNMAAMNQDYYSQTLQALIESIELLLDEGLGLAGDGTQVLGVELDLEGLLRMDPLQRSQRNSEAVKGGYWSPDEARKTDNLPPVPEGAGKVPYMQQQQFPLTTLAKQPAPGSTPPPAPAPAQPPEPAPSAPSGPPAPSAPPAPTKSAEDIATEALRGFLEELTKGLEHA